MKDWLTIGRLAKETGLTARALRFYEAKGLLRSHSRGENDYRFYSSKELRQALHIKEFRDLGFTLDEIAELISQDPTLTKENLQASLEKKSRSLKIDQTQASERIQKLETLIASLKATHKLSEQQRRIVMNELVIKTKEKLKSKGVNISTQVDEHLRIEFEASQSKQFSKMMDLLDLIKEVADDAKIRIGPGRGSAAGSLLLFSKGFNYNYSQDFGLLPELFFNAIKPLIWIDVEYEAGPDFLNRLLQKTTLEELRSSNIFIFQCPFLSILSEVEKEVGPIDFESIANDDAQVLESFRNGQAEHIFCFDAPEKSIMHTNSSLDFWKRENELKRNLWKILETYKVSNAEDILNLCTLSFPVVSKEQMIKDYVGADKFVPSSNVLPKEVLEILTKTKGLLIYREDLIKILRLYLDWSVAECNQFYSMKMGRFEGFNKTHEYDESLPNAVKEFLEREVKGVFLKSHMVCMWWFIKISSILNFRHPEKYRAAIKSWQDNHHSAWSDLGFIDKDFRPLALYF